MTMILAIDPGTTESAWCLLGEDGVPAGHAKEPNTAILSRLGLADFRGLPLSVPYRVVIERMQSYGMMQVGDETFETCYWIGEFRYVARTRCLFAPELVKRTEVKLHHCGSPRAKDPQIRRAMLDRFGIGGQRPPKDSPLATFSADQWSALAIATYAWDIEKGRK